MKVPSIDVKATGNNIKKLRTERGISVRELQRVLTFISPQSIYKWENGYCLPSLDNLLLLAFYLDLKVEDILVVNIVEKDK